VHLLGARHKLAIRAGPKAAVSPVLPLSETEPLAAVAAPAGLGCKIDVLLVDDLSSLRAEELHAGIVTESSATARSIFVRAHLMVGRAPPYVRAAKRF
jgi:hypothetical protein